jgi:hypothetical protein
MQNTKEKIKVDEHDFDNNGICKKCHTHKNKVINGLCPVIGREEIASFRND